MSIALIKLYDIRINFRPISLFSIRSLADNMEDEFKLPASVVKTQKNVEEMVGLLKEMITLQKDINTNLIQVKDRLNQIKL